MLKAVEINKIKIVFLLSILSVSCREKKSSSEEIDLIGDEAKIVAETVATLAVSNEVNELYGLDLIQDLVFRKQRDGWSLTSTDAHVNVNKLKTANLRIVFSALPYISAVSPEKTTIKAMEDMNVLAAETEGAVEIAESWNNAKKIASEGRIAVLLMTESSDAFAEDFELLKNLKKRGLIMVGLAATRNNILADVAVAPRDPGGLTNKGKLFLRELRDLGIAVNLAHASKQTFWDTLVEQSGSAVVSHSAVAALADHPRNLDDLQILALLRYGGLLGINFNPEFLTIGSSASMDDLISHIMHIKALGAISIIALGTDFGGIVPPSGIEDISALPKVFEALSHRGVTKVEMDGLKSANAVRFFDSINASFGSVPLTKDEILRPLSVDCEFVSGQFEGRPAFSCNGFVREVGVSLKPSTKQRFRLKDVASTPVTLEIFGDPGVIWQVEAQNLAGKIIFHKIVQLNDSGNGTLSLPSGSNLTRLFLSPTRMSALKEAVIWGRAPIVSN